MEIMRLNKIINLIDKCNSSYSIIIQFTLVPSTTVRLEIATNCYLPGPVDLRF